eukprot:Nitzschia sp. Nitz4//scaffold146_size56529//4623//10014//NITZ4_006569-RA/size56529-augustus-gene-0.20-mRNA-1//-1//CDS//3329536614//493//frame0
MPVPIVVGGKSISVQSLPGPYRRPDESDDGVVLEPKQLHQTLTWGKCPQQEWLVRVSSSFYDLVDVQKDERNCTMVEVRIQVSPLALPLSSDYRETEHHLKLFDNDEHQNNNSDSDSDSDRNAHVNKDIPLRRPQVVVSSDRRNLAVLLFHPHHATSSSLVIFQLRKPRTDLPGTEHPIMVPSYVQKAMGSHTQQADLTRRDPPAVATHPRFVSVAGITTVCTLPHVTPSVFLAACDDGNLAWLDARSSMALASGVLEIPPDQLPLRTMAAAASASSATMTMDRGRLLAVTRNGKVTLLSWAPDTGGRGNHSKSKSSSSSAVTPLKQAKTGTVVWHNQTENPTEQLRMLNPNTPATPASPPPRRMKSADAMPSPTNSTSSLHSLQSLQSLLRPLRNRRLPGRAISGDGTNALELPGLKLSFEKTKDTNDNNNNNNNDRATSASLDPQETVRELRALQKTSAASETTTADSTTVSSSGSTTSALIQSPQRQYRKTPGRVRSDYARHRESITDSSMPLNDSSLKRKMKLWHVASVDPDQEAESAVLDAQFANQPTVFCVLYDAKKHQRRQAQIFAWDGTVVLKPLLTLRLTREQLDQAFAIGSSGTTGNDAGVVSQGALQPQLHRQEYYGLDYDAASDTFAISASLVVDRRWIGCLWSWRSNTMGWMVQRPYRDDTTPNGWSRVWFARHPERGSFLTILESSQERYLKCRKEVVEIGLLSPEASNATSPGIARPNSLMLSRDAVYYPDVSQQPTGLNDWELEWKVSTLPINYRNSYGPPSLAAVGHRNGISLAVASSSGVCVFDHRSCKWKQFGTPSEERSFQVVDMVWWEGQEGGGSEDKTDDLLVALIQSNNGRQYLSMWSHKRFDLAHQLLEPSKLKPVKNDESRQSSWGVPLPSDMKATGLTFLAETVPNKRSHHLRRAVVVATRSDMKKVGLEFAYFQLQVTTQNSKVVVDAESYSELMPFRVVAQMKASGLHSLKDHPVGSLSSVFLGGCSFVFDLDQDNDETKSEKKDLAIFGLVHTPGGLEAMTLHESGDTDVAPVMVEKEISSVRLGDVMEDCSQVAPESQLSQSFVWTVKLLNGQLHTWMVPSGTWDSMEVRTAPPLGAWETSALHPKGLAPPAWVKSKGDDNPDLPGAFGVVCHIGSSADWLQHSSSGTQGDISLGIVPESNFGCALKAGQKSIKLQRSGLGGDFDPDLFAGDFLDTNVFCLTETDLIPPVFVPSAYMMVLEIAHIRLAMLKTRESSGTEMLIASYSERIKYVEKHIQHRLTSCQNKDAVMMALRLLILRSTELLCSMTKKHRQTMTSTSGSHFSLSRILFAEIVDIVRQCTTNLQFASLFLEVGRQIEPSFLEHLFPLPTTFDQTCIPESGTDRYNASSVSDLFSLCLQEGSLTASASSLPLLNNRTLSRRFCNVLLSTAIEKYFGNAASSEIAFDKTVEERQIIGDIFRFAMKMEDATTFETSESFNHGLGLRISGLQDTDDTGGDMGTSASTFETDSESEGYTRSSFRNVLCVGSSHRSSILNFMIPGMFDNKNDDEDAIRQAASTFLDHQKEKLDFIDTEDSDESDSDEEFESDNSPELESIAALVCRSIVQQLTSNDSSDRMWTVLCGLTRLFRQGQNVDSDVFLSALEMTTLQTYDILVPASSQKTPEESIQESLSQRLQTEMERCSLQLSAMQSFGVLGFISFLLERFDSTDSLAKLEGSLKAGLLFAWVITAHVSNGMDELLDLSKIPSSPLLDCYKNIVS